MGTMATQCKSSSLLALLGYWGYRFSGHGRRRKERVTISSQSTDVVKRLDLMCFTYLHLADLCLTTQCILIYGSSVIRVQSCLPNHFTIMCLVHCVTCVSIFNIGGKWFSVVFLPFIPKTEARLILSTKPPGQPNQRRYTTLKALRLLIHQL